MRRNFVLAILCTLILLPVAPAPAQTLVPNPAEILGGGDEKEAPDEAGDGCGIGVTLICAGEALGGGAAGIAADAVTGAAGAAGDAVMEGIVSWAASGAAWLVTEIGTQIDRSTRPAIGSSWFGARYAALRELAVALALLFVLAAVMQAVIRQDLRLLSRSLLVALPAALLLMFAAVTLTELALGVTDWMTATTLESLGTDARTAFTRLGERLAPSAMTGNPLPGLVMLLAAALMAVLALVVWIELVLREASIYVALCFMPIALVGLVWKPTASWARRLAEWLGAIILAKFTIAVAFAIAGSALANAPAGRSGGLSALLAGCAVLLVAALTPWILLRLLPGSASAADGFHRGVVRQAASTAIGARTASAITRQAMLRTFTPTASAGGVVTAHATPPQPPPPSPPEPGPTLPDRSESAPPRIPT